MNNKSLQILYVFLFRTEKACLLPPICECCKAFPRVINMYKIHTDFPKRIFSVFYSISQPKRGNITNFTFPAVVIEIIPFDKIKF